ncbi:hypothetical protein EVAR_52849_1 [Eumeta japonica]|uniref:Uncharacterized protein n=1 Tax=Eumeta variegata TaxID=151549 RepID=A0A4C1YD96_EUMVA|nr:hypothetical protein EVAR_52849_1 [Eumeta japonica]
MKFDGRRRARRDVISSRVGLKANFNHKPCNERRPSLRMTTSFVVRLPIEVDFAPFERKKRSTAVRRRPGLVACGYAAAVPRYVFMCLCRVVSCPAITFIHKVIRTEKKRQKFLGLRETPGTEAETAQSPTAYSLLTLKCEWRKSWARFRYILKLKVTVYLGYNTKGRSGGEAVRAPPLTRSWADYYNVTTKITGEEGRKPAQYFSVVSERF